MFAVRIHGRGGQGVVTAAELHARAAFLEGRHAQAQPRRARSRRVRRRLQGADRARHGVCPDNAVIKLDQPGPYQYEIDLDFCKGCGLCAAECPAGAIEMTPEEI